MTPSQMLKRIVEAKSAPVAPHVWVPAERIKPIVIPSGGVSAYELLFQEQSLVLLQGKCPLCHAEIDHEIDSHQMVTFRCKRQPAFHEWRRTLSFLSQGVFSDFEKR